MYNIVAVPGDVRDESLLKNLFETHKPPWARAARLSLGEVRLSLGRRKWSWRGRGRKRGQAALIVPGGGYRRI